MRPVIDWIFSPPTKREFMRLPFIILAIDVVYSIVAIGVMELLNLGSEMIEDPDATPIASWEFPVIIISVSVIEELLFRIIPLVILIRYVNNRFVTLFSVIALSVSFGLIHSGWESVPVQGVGGILYSILFIKYAENGTRFLQASAVVILVHTIFNAILTLAIVLGGDTTF